MEFPSGIQRRGTELGLLSRSADIEDTEYLSKYFVLQEFSPDFTAGKNAITFNGSEYLKRESEVLVECIDSAGESLYIESTQKTTVVYKEAPTYVLSIHVYDDASNGPGKLILYGMLSTGETVRWIGNIMIDKTKQNVSVVRFYNKPSLEIHPILSNVISSVAELVQDIEFTGSFYSYAVSPTKDSPKYSKRNVDVDYRIFSRNISKELNPTNSFNSQLVGTNIELNIKRIQEPYSYKIADTALTSSFSVKKVINSSTIIIDNSVFYKDKNKNDVVTNVVDGNFNINYPYITYNTASESSSYLTTEIDGKTVYIKHSYADIIYRNLRTFSGFIARHKLYRKSLFSPGDFEVIADEPLSSYEILRDKLTTNSSFDKMGAFYNQRHINKYWFTSSILFEITQDSNKLIDGMYIKNTTGKCSDLNSLSNYVIVKDNSAITSRNFQYYPYNETEYLASSGSSYDSNFIELKKQVNYVISLNAILEKDNSSINDSEAQLEFYFTSSFNEINDEPSSIKSQIGLMKLGTLSAYEPLKEKVYSNVSIIFTPFSDLYGTMIIVPRKCNALISELSIKPYENVGFSPDILINRVPFPINVANEAYEIKAELFDVNSNLVYSDLRTVTTFDPSGSSLIMYIPGLKDPSKTTFISGSLRISESLVVGYNATIEKMLTVVGPVKFEGIAESSYTKERMLAWHPDTKLVSYTNVNDIDHSGGTVLMKLYGKNSTNVNTYRVLASVEGRNIFVS